MFAPVHAFSGFSVDDLDAARKFYGETLGLQVTDGEMGVLQLALPTGPQVIVYPKENHEPALSITPAFTPRSMISQSSITSSTMWMRRSMSSTNWA